MTDLKMMVIYKTTNQINGKIYVGYDTRNCPDYYGSGKYYKRAEKKHGKENFRKAIIDCDVDFSALCRKEVFWIDFYDARNPAIGYNFAEGGACWRGPHSEETKIKIGVARKGTHRSEETKAKISATNSDGRNKGENNPMSFTNRERRRMHNEDK